MSELLTQIFVFPRIVLGIEGRLWIEITKLCGLDEPHSLLAITEIVPPVSLDVAVRELVVELPVQPSGNVHV